MSSVPIANAKERLKLLQAAAENGLQRNDVHAVINACNAARQEVGGGSDAVMRPARQCEAERGGVAGGQGNAAQRVLLLAARPDMPGLRNGVPCAIRAHLGGIASFGRGRFFSDSRGRYFRAILSRIPRSTMFFRRKRKVSRLQQAVAKALEREARIHETAAAAFDAQADKAEKQAKKYEAEAKAHEEKAEQGEKEFRERRAEYKKEAEEYEAVAKMRVNASYWLEKASQAREWAEKRNMPWEVSHEREAASRAREQAAGEREDAWHKREKASQAQGEAAVLRKAASTAREDVSYAQGIASEAGEYISRARGRLKDAWKNANALGKLRADRANFVKAKDVQKAIDAAQAARNTLNAWEKIAAANGEK